MPISIRVTNTVRDGNGLRVFYEMIGVQQGIKSDSLLFDLNAGINEIKARLQAEKQREEDAQAKFEAIASELNALEL